MLGRLLKSPAFWTGIVLAALPFVLARFGVVGVDHPKLWAVAGFALGYYVGGKTFGFPRKGPQHPWEQDLAFNDTGDVHKAMEAAIAGMRQLLSRNPENRFDGELQQKLRALLQRLETLLAQWEGSKGALSLEEDFHARQIALAYLPDALRGYLSLPKAFATQKLLENGHTARDTLVMTLGELDTKVGELQDDLAGQDAQSFLSHSRFIDTKFRRNE
jgi:hypothetical protein